LPCDQAAELVFREQPRLEEPVEPVSMSCVKEGRQRLDDGDGPRERLGGPLDSRRTSASCSRPTPASSMRPSFMPFRLPASDAVRE
jgi:hypothetical protein